MASRIGYWKAGFENMAGGRLGPGGLGLSRRSGSAEGMVGGGGAVLGLACGGPSTLGVKVARVTSLGIFNNFLRGPGQVPPLPQHVPVSTPARWRLPAFPAPASVMMGKGSKTLSTLQAEDSPV